MVDDFRCLSSLALTATINFDSITIFRSRIDHNPENSRREHLPTSAPPPSPSPHFRGNFAIKVNSATASPPQPPVSDPY